MIKKRVRGRVVRGGYAECYADTGSGIREYRNDQSERGIRFPGGTKDRNAKIGK
jgi:hypothetical protein